MYITVMNDALAMVFPVSLTSACWDQAQAAPVTLLEISQYVK